MAAPGRDPLKSKIPVTVLTGFLGAGKTTLLTKLLKHPDMNRAAVVINEIGEVGIDNDLVTMSTENISLLANGCICCTVRTDLQDTLVDLFTKRKQGVIPDFDRVIVETTGLADPAPVIQTLSTDVMIANHFRLDGLVTLVDAVNGAGQLDREAQALKQAAVADRLLLTKVDLAEPIVVASLRERLRSLNAEAEMRDVVMGDIDPAFLTQLGLRSVRSDEAAMQRFLGAVAYDNDAPSYLGSRLGARHDSSIKTFSLRFDEPFTWTVFSCALELLASLRGPDLLRMKGIVNVEGKPVVVQGVQHIFSPPIELERWPSDDQRTRLVFITRNINAGTVEALLRAAGGLAASAG
ncbi:MAG: GTP-binding protein [Burkholderiales bacterium]